MEDRLMHYPLVRKLMVLSGAHASLQRTIPSVRNISPSPSSLLGTGILTCCPSATLNRFALGPD
nr:hypothetical protein [uncultured bacterium]